MAIQRDATKELQRWTATVSDAAMTFRRRWTELGLERVDPALARLLRSQIDIFDDACLLGTPEQIAHQGAASCRGWAAAVRAMEAAGAEDDGYLLGHDPVTGTKVAIGNHKGVIERVQELHGRDVICITPDEIAVMIGTVEALSKIAAVKKLFPGAEIVRKNDQGS